MWRAITNNIGSAGLVLVVLAGHSPAHAISCEIECAKSNSPYCLTVPKLAGGPDIPWALRNLLPFTVARLSGGTIAPMELLGFFGMTKDEDPCKRGTTDFENGRLKNSGESSCRITVSGPALMGQHNVQLGFDVPQELVSTVERKSDQLIFSFDQSIPNSTPLFWIDDADLNSDWGGLISEIQYSVDEVIVTTSNGCIAYRF